MLSLVCYPDAFLSDTLPTIGTPFCVTINFTTLEDQTVTVRERDSMSQIRLQLNEVPAYLLERVRWDYSV